MRTKSIANYAERLRWLIDLAHQQGVTLGEITRENIRGYIVTCLRRDPPLSTATVNGRLAAWRAFYNYACDPDRHSGQPLLDNNPMKGVRLLRIDETEPAWLRPEQVNKVLRFFDLRSAHGSATPFITSRNRNIALLLYDTMIRPGELCRLTLEDINLRTKTGGMLTVRQSKSRRTRHVPIHADVARSLHTYLHRFRKELPGDTLFCYEDGREMTVQRLSRLFGRVGKLLGFRVTPYMFRHGGATGYSMRGGNIEILQTVMGHSDIRITRKYVHAGEEFAAEQHPRFSALNLLREK